VGPLYYQAKRDFLHASQKRFTEWGEANNHQRVGAAIQEFHDLFVVYSFLLATKTMGPKTKTCLVPPSSTQCGSRRPVDWQDAVRKDVLLAGRSRLQTFAGWRLAKGR
jgi:hypothetical protein